MAAHFFTTIENQVTGKPVANASVYLLTALQTAGGTELTLYSDEALSVPLDNPLTSDTAGWVEAYLAEDEAVVEIWYDGELRKAISNWNFVGGEVSGDVTALQTRMDAAEVITQDATIVAFKGLTGAADKVPYFTGTDTMALADFTAAGRALVDDPSASAQRTTLGLGTIATFDEATTAQFRSNTADKALSTDQVWAAADYVALSDAATVDVDMSAGFNFSLTIGGNRTLGAPTNTKNGQTGAIVITQDGTGSRTLAYHANWKFAGGTDPTLSTAAGAVDVLFYQVISSTSIIGNLVKAIA